MKLTSSIVLLFATLIMVHSALPANAWDNPAHMAIAGIAFDELNHTEQLRLAAMLREHPDVNRLYSGLGTDHPSGKSLVMAASVWPDLIKSDSSYRNNGYRERGPITSVSFDHIKHKGWHFIDTPVSLDGTPVGPAPDGDTVDAVTVINVLVRQLNSNESGPQKAYDLGWLLHLEGDLHQPLHCVTGITAAMPKGDVGGNAVKIAGDTEGARELHAFWDDVLGKTARRDRTTHKPRLDKDVTTALGIMASVRAVKMPPDQNSTNPSIWVRDGVALAKRDVYHLQYFQAITATRRGRDVPEESATLTASYDQIATIDARRQVRVAGHRLALMLKRILDRKR